MEFAKKQLQKFGWKEGTGLGKNEQGILSAIKPTLKVGKEGMGYDFSKELIDTWWTRAYDDSLKRINIEVDTSTSESIQVSLQDDDNDGNGDLSKESGTERPFQKMRKRMMKASFPSFSKGATLSNGEMIADEKNSDSDGSESEVNEASAKLNAAITSLTDEELLKACNGRTAHKAARFGLKLSGKLARIAAQDATAKSSVVKYSSLNTAPETQIDLQNSGTVIMEQHDKSKHKDLKKKKSKKHKVEVLMENEYAGLHSLPVQDVPVIMDGDYVSGAITEPEDKTEKKRKKNKKRKHDTLEEDEALLSHIDAKKVEHVMISVENDGSSIIKLAKKSKKHKKSKYSKNLYDKNNAESCALLSS